MIAGQVESRLSESQYHSDTLILLAVKFAKNFEFPLGVRFACAERLESARASLSQLALHPAALLARLRATPGLS